MSVLDNGKINHLAVEEIKNNKNILFFLLFIFMYLVLFTNITFCIQILVILSFTDINVFDISKLRNKLSINYYKGNSRF